MIGFNPLTALTLLDTAIKAGKKIVKDYQLHKLESTETNSLSSVVKLTRVEPLTILSQSVKNLDYISDVNQALLAMFSGYYLQAVAIVSNLKNVEVIKTLDALNPDRSSQGVLLQARAEDYSDITTESISPSLEQYKYSLLPSAEVSVESSQTDNIKVINEASNMSIGKLLNVEIATGDGNKVTTIPVSIRLMVSILTSDSIIKILLGGKEDTSLVERYHAWRSGRISFIKDLILCADLIREHKRSIITDESGTIQEILRRVTNSKLYGLASGNPSLAAASNLFVISDDEAKDIEFKLGGKLKVGSVRKKLFESTYALVIAVVDKEYDRVIFYVRDTDSYTDLSIKEIKQSNKNKGSVDLMDIMKSLSMGHSASF